MTNPTARSARKPRDRGVEPKQAAGASLLATDSFVSAILDNIEEAIVACDENGLLALFNRAARRFHGLPEQPLPPERWSERYSLFRADGKTPLKREEIPLFRAFQGETVKALEMVIAPKGLPARRIVANGQPVLDSAGKKIGAVVVMHDYTERWRTEDELRRQSRLFEYIVDNIPASIFWKNREGRFMGMNTDTLRDFGFQSRDQVIGRDDFELSPKAEAEHFRQDDQEVMESGKPKLNIEEPQQRPDGLHFLLTNKVPLRDEEGAVIGILGVYLDITERKRMEEELAKAKEAAEVAAKAKGEFLALISHELRTPLTLILGPLELLLASDKLSPDLRDELERIHRHANRLHTMVRDILDFTKVEVGMMSVDWEWVDVNEEVSRIVADASTGARRAGLTLTFSPDRELELVPLDVNKFEKIVLNLVGNALKFTPAGGRVEVRLTSLGDKFELAVRDTGPGIAEEKQNLLFRRFQQIDTSSTRTHEGTGLGLALVKEFSSLMGGSVTVRSKRGEGAEFSVQFSSRTDLVPAPRRERSERRREATPKLDEYVGPRPHERASGVHDGKLPLVLVVEDNPDMRAYLCEVLRDEHEVASAANGREAFAALKQLKPEVIISDVMMPEMDGYELVDQLKNRPEYRNIPVILLTAKASREDLVRGLRAGADDYLRKPFGPEELRARVLSAQRMHRIYLELAESHDDLRNSQEQLIHAGKLAAVGTLIAGLSHELNNPIGSILANAQLMLASKSRNEATLRNALTVIERQTLRCAELVRSLLEFSRKEPIERQAVSVRSLLERLRGLAEPLARQRGIRLKFEQGAADQEVWASRPEIETGLLNLVSNSLDAVLPGQSIEISSSSVARDGRNGVEFSVRDEGCGIDKDVLPRIFEPFFTTKPPGKGTGQGLALVRKITECHGGRVYVESEVGVGTRIRMWLPVGESGTERRGTEAGS